MDLNSNNLNTIHPQKESNSLLKDHLVYIKTQGCKVNIADSQGISHQLSKAGFTLTKDYNKAHFIVINSCSVTSNAEKETRYLIRRYAREASQAKVFITGCYAQIDGASIAKLDNVQGVIPNQAKHQLVNYLVSIALSTKDQINLLTINDQSTNSVWLKEKLNLNLVESNKQAQFKSSHAYFTAHSTNNYSRSFIKIQDGCNDFCSYCQIPYARGASTSVARKLIISEINRLLNKGCKEIVISGIHLSQWGKDLNPRSSLIELLTEIISVIASKSYARIRLSSLEPSKFDHQLFEFISNHKKYICPHLHFPMQSGSDRILKLMKRGYDRNTYLTTIKLAKQAFNPIIPHISADIMVGFPSETPDDFAYSVDLIKRSNLSSLHVFRYSKRPNTLALKLSGHLSPHIIKQRSLNMISLGEKLKHQFYRSFIKKTVSVVWEDKYDQKHRRLGSSAEYLKVCKYDDYHRGFDQNNKISQSISSHIVKGFVTKDLLLVD